MVQTKEINAEVLTLLLTENMPPKYMRAVLMVGIKKQQRKWLHKVNYSSNNKWHYSKNKQNCFSVAGSKISRRKSKHTSTRQVDAQVQGQMNQLKEETMAKQKQQLLQNKLIESQQDHNFKKDEINQKAFAETEAG
jgi:hypothetical protein